MFTSKVFLLVPLVLALTRQAKADLSSACSFFAIVGSGFDTSSSTFSLYAFPAETSPVDTTNGTALGITSDSVLGLGGSTLFALNDGTLGVPALNLTAPLLVNGTDVAITETTATASQFCLIASTSPEGGSPLPMLGVNGTLDDNFALCGEKVVFRPTDSTGCEVVDIRMIN